MRPILSVVTPCLNAAAYIESAVRSVADQGRSDIEHIVIDGGSTDGTLDILSRFPQLRVIRQRDNNLYEALNRGIELAQGDIIGQLNADDCYIPGAFERVIGAMRAHQGVDMISGSAIVGREGIDAPGEGEPIETCPLEIDKVVFGRPAINARFVTRGLYRRVGLYDTGFRRAADREFLLRTVVAGAENVRIGEPLYWYRAHAGSLTIGGNRRRYLSVGREHMDIARRYLNDARLSENDRRALRRWHTEGATLAAADALLAGRIGGLADVLGEALSVDALAGPRLCRFSAEKLARMLWTGRRRGR